MSQLLIDSLSAPNPPSLALLVMAKLNPVDIYPLPGGANAELCQAGCCSALQEVTSRPGSGVFLLSCPCSIWDTLWRSLWQVQQYPYRWFYSTVPPTSSFLTNGPVSPLYTQGWLIASFISISLKFSASQRAEAKPPSRKHESQFGREKALF